MSDLQINIALARAMGWESSTWNEWGNLSKDGFVFDNEKVYCSYKGDLTIRFIDYRDPVIFVSICKRWQLVVNFRDGFASGIDGINIVGEWEKPHFIEKATALVVIELAKRGVK